MCLCPGWMEDSWRTTSAVVSVLVHPHPGQSDDSSEWWVSVLCCRPGALSCAPFHSSLGVIHQCPLTLFNSYRLLTPVADRMRFHSRLNGIENHKYCLVVSSIVLRSSLECSSLCHLRTKDFTLVNLTEVTYGRTEGGGICLSVFLD